MKQSKDLSTTKRQPTSQAVQASDEKRKPEALATPRLSKTSNSRMETQMTYNTAPKGATTNYPDRPGYRGLTEPTRATSREAAKKVAGLAKSQSGRILAELKAVYPEGRSSEQIAAATGILVYSVRARMSGLLASGAVQETDERTKNDAGFAVTLWRAVL